jgi:hypothetical protein
MIQLSDSSWLISRVETLSFVSESSEATNGENPLPIPQTHFSIVPDVQDSTAFNSFGLPSLPFTVSEKFFQDDGRNRGQSTSPGVWIGIGVGIAVIALLILLLIILMKRGDSSTESPSVEFGTEEGFTEERQSWEEATDDLECLNPIGVTIDANDILDVLSDQTEESVGQFIKTGD